MRFHFIKGKSDLQVTMTYHNFRKRHNSKIKSIVSTILIFLFAFVSSAILIVEKRKYKQYDERIFYFVSVASSKTTKLLEDKKELLKNFGGANVIMMKRDVSHLIASCYLDQVSALEIMENLKSYFPEVEILKVKLERVSIKGIKAVKSIIGGDELIKCLYKISNEYQSIQMKYLSGEMTEGQFLSAMIDKKIILEKTMENVDKESELSQKILGFCDVMVLSLTNFLSGLTIAKHKQNYVCNYFVGFYMNYVELFECL